MFVVLLAAAAFLLLPGGHFGLWIAAAVILAVAMFITCFAKGETARWRWGESDEPRARSSSDRLAELDELHRRQLVSEAEYEAKRQEILRGL
jgi:cytochrome c-type biogenesis protein CcmI